MMAETNLIFNGEDPYEGFSNEEKIAKLQYYLNMAREDYPDFVEE